MKGLFIVLITCLSLFACTNRQEPETIDQNNRIEERLIRANKIMADHESKLIRDFITRNGWKMDSTGTGLRYMIQGEKDGLKPDKKDVVEINYTLNLLSGEEVYATKEKPFTFALSTGQQTNGLEEGIKLMHVGENAIFLVPSHLGYGLSGDGKNVPPKSVLIYKVNLISVNKNR